ncbi:MAG: DUF2075 domain-containing protein [Phycisphaeraceae bacterium]|nr:DUF2075 domain-containing protein [Phycisphaeraceae bacterium]
MALEYAVPRVGRRIDVLLVLRQVIFVLEYKVGDTRFTAHATEQVWDYALDLKNFHSTSHDKPICPILVATDAHTPSNPIALSRDQDGLFAPIHATLDRLGDIIAHVLSLCEGSDIDTARWESGHYQPTPTIIEAARALYSGHGVENISRSDGSAINLSQTSAAVEEIINSSRTHRRKSLCLVTGVPGAGKTLVGLNIATRHMERSSDLYSVFLSGNGPLVAILREALARDRVLRESAAGHRMTLGTARSEIKVFIQNVHHFRDECLLDVDRPPIERVAIFDEAQRAWDKAQTAHFMRRKKGHPHFDRSEPDFLISCLDRHHDWAVIVCLVGGGQEINTGEAGIGEWIRAAVEAFPHWDIYVSPRLHDSEYAAGNALQMLAGRPHVMFNDDLHLAVSVRSFRAEHVSTFVKHLLDLNMRGASEIVASLDTRYPITITRDLGSAKQWLKRKARGSERYGLVVSSQAQRLKPQAIDIRSPIDPVHWFLDPRTDVRSSYYLEDAATEFHIQGLELDWACVVWDADFRYTPSGWSHWSFRGDRWQRIRSDQRKTYLKNAYRVLLTRARQGLVIVVPRGSDDDPTRSHEFYDSTYEYLRSLGLHELR